MRAGESRARLGFSDREQGCEGATTLVGDEASLPNAQPPLSKNIGGREKLVERGARVDACVLADPSKNLKRLLQVN